MGEPFQIFGASMAILLVIASTLSAIGGMRHRSWFGIATGGILAVDFVAVVQMFF